MPPARILLIAATLGGIALMVRSILFEPVSIELASAALVGYLALATIGVLFPQMEMFGDVLWRGEPSDGVVLTFDDGPHPEYTRRVLEILEAHQVQATFFLIGKKVAAHPDVVREIVEAGHHLGLHSYEHVRTFAFKTPREIEAEILRTQAAIEEACGQRPDWFRPPIGHVSTRVAAGAKRARVILVAWSGRGRDGLRGAKPAQVLERLKAAVRPGAILLLHDAAERDDFEPVSLKILDQLLEHIQAEGLKVVGLHTLLEPAEVGPKRP